MANTLMQMPNLLLIAGNGRNVGKTFLACKIIQHFAQNESITGIKITPHFHETDENDVLVKNERFIIAEEKQINSKDSSLFLQAGAKRVFFVMAKQENLPDAFNELKKQLNNNLIICESGGLHELVSPGLFLFVNRKNEELVKTQFLKYNPILVNNDGQNFDFDIQNIEIQNNKFTFKN